MILIYSFHEGPCTLTLKAGLRLCPITLTTMTRLQEREEEAIQHLPATILIHCLPFLTNTRETTRGDKSSTLMGLTLERTGQIYSSTWMCFCGLIPHTSWHTFFNNLFITFFRSRYNNTHAPRGRNYPSPTLCKC